MMHTIYDFFKNTNEAVDSIEDEEEFKNILKKSLKNASLKLKKYLTTDKQPSFKFLNEIRIFDPQQAKSAENFENINLFDLQNIPAFVHINTSRKIDLKAKLIGEFNKYKTIISNDNFYMKDDCLKFWNQKINVFPNLAPIIISYLSVPISGAEVERSFSHLNNVLTDRRSLKVENLRDLLLLNFNSNF